MRPPHHLLLGLLLLLCLRAPPRPAAAADADTDTVSPGNGLAGTGARLVSNNSKFALGFFKADSRSPNTYLGIWFNKVPKLTPLWSANGDSPVVDPASPELAISGDGNLVIRDRATAAGSVVWSTRANTTTTRTVAVLLDDGNLVLRSAANASDVFWQSFDHPTDTLFAGAKIGWDKRTGVNRRLVSRKNSVDQAPGLYSLEFDFSGVGHLVWNSTVEYWSTGSWNGKYFGLAPEMIGAVMPSFKFVNNSEEAYFIYYLHNDTAIVHTAIDFSGRGLVGIWLDSLQDWLVNYRQPVAQCDVHATCGPFTVCNEAAHETCSCMKGFSVRSPGDWDLGDRTDGCMRNTPLGCASDRFYPVQSVSLPYGAEKVQAAAGEDDCEQACLGNCSCTAYSYGGGSCSIWHGKLYNVKQQSGAASDRNGVALYIRLAAAEMASVETKKSGISTGAVIGVAVGASAAAAILVIILGLVIWRRKGKWFGSKLEDAQGGIGIIAFRYVDLQRATKNFSEKLGGGSFGSVFKGCLNDSVTLAVKRLDGAHQGEKQFRAEVNSVGIIQHINLVKLIGFCCEGDKRMLVYEYMPNHSLDVHLFKADDTVLDWNVRYQIAIGVARGLAYLHTSCRDCIIHCDIKPENILLDASFVPKIADFGMAKVLGREFSHAMTTMRGTIGYLAPEWIGGTVVTSKVDVYSYGMVLFEIISGRRNSCPEYFKDGDYSNFFPMQAARKLLSGEIASLLDAKLHGDVNLKEVERICKVACWCIQENELARPTMAEVVQFLEGLSELDMPPLPRLLNAVTGGSPTSLRH
ncbi:G-type lectin S-receptor-like serine/threonine-protein kinase At2g19130 [Panicum virgatum]|uniref:Receptor-like serine/threonine-protein kinase n=1 Tax=Panicum virgatum TaxID=38727 RepID=A0A8T0WC65_PANVG|nr:G-type lectin S-receptor-like serine/threonine-protein kinase At2g19130 [Panicum virgatum]KAG2645350.1 hypothetical protein PVAP13_2KG421935 [Panicum virgatum]